MTTWGKIDRGKRTPIGLSFGDARICFEMENKLLKQMDHWRADRHVFNRVEAFRMMVRWACATDTSGKLRPVKLDDPILDQLDEWRFAHHVTTRTEAMRQIVVLMLSQPFPVGNAKPVSGNRKMREAQVPNERDGWKRKPKTPQEASSPSESA